MYVYIYIWVDQPNMVGGVPTQLKNMSVSVGMMTFPTGKHNSCSKPPTRKGLWFPNNRLHQAFQVFPPGPRHPELKESWVKHVS